MTYSEILDKFNDSFPFANVEDYRPICHELFEDGKEGCTIWLDNGDMVVYYPNQERGDAVNEMMTFPDTWEEFEKSYGFTDNEEVYTNGARLIPSFRAKQWLDHLSPPQSQKSEWIWDGDIFDLEKEYICRKCGHYALEKDGNQIRSNFCPNCGADMRPQFEEPEINPCRGCEDYDGKGGCKSKGGCAGSRGDSE